jgi:hypothetical protein
MGKTQKTGNLVNIVVTDNDKNVTLPKALTIGEVPPIDDDSFKVPTTSWVKTKVDTKVDKVTGKGLSTNDFTDTLKTKLDGIEAGAEVNVNADWNAVSGDAQILNKPLIQPQLNGLGFVKANGTTISYDNSTYLTTISGITAGGELSGTYPNPTLVTSAVTGKLLSGVNITGGTIVATDSILTAFGKVQNQINSLVGGVNYQGIWNATSNLPTLTSSVGTKGYYYVVGTAGFTNLNGITDWKLGDWVIFNGSTWDKVDNTDSVISVNGFTGAVSLTTDNISEGSTNLYYTNTRVRGAISLTTSGTSGAATYDNGTGVLNIPNYGSALSGYVTLDTTQTITGLKTFTSSGSANTIIVNHTSGSGHGIDITKAGSGEGLRINKTSGGGNAASITGGITLLSELNLTTKLADAHINSAATWNAKIGGSGTTNYLAKFTASGTVGNSLIYDNGTNVGVGTTSPVAKLTILGSNSIGGSIPTSWAAISSGRFGIVNGNNSFYFDLSSTPYAELSTYNYSTGTTFPLVLQGNGGNVGIGSTSPLNKLHINDNSGIRISSPTNSNFRGITFGATEADATEYSYIKYNPSSGEMRYWANPTGFGGFTSFYSNAIESMRITSAGNVGIGTTTPSGKLHVVGGSTTTSISNAATTVNTRFDVANPAVSLGIGYVSADIPMIQSFNNGTNAAANLTINPFGGNVGIGATSPTTKTQITTNLGGTNPSTYTDVLTIGVSNGQNETAKPNIGSSLVFRGIEYYNQEFALARIAAQKTLADWNGFLTFHTNPGNQDGTTTERMRITSSGNVGIACSPNFGRVEIQGSTTDKRLYIGTNAFYSNSIDVLGINSSGSEIPLGIGGSQIQYYTGSSERMRITSAGNLLINSTTDDGANKLQVTGNVKITGSITATLGGFNSDINDKKDLIYGAKSNVLELNAASYLRKSTNNKEYGYIAQDVKKVLPEAVYETVSGLAVSYHMVNAAKIQALQEKIVSLEETIKLLSK